MIDDMRDTRPWFWVLFLIVFAVAVVGLVLAISAKNSSVDEDKIVNEATAQIKEELAGLNGALKAANEFQSQSNKAAAQDRRRIKRAVGKATAGAQKRLGNLSKRVASLETATGDLKGENKAMRKNIAALTQDQQALEAETRKLRKTVRNLNGNGGTANSDK